MTRRSSDYVKVNIEKRIYTFIIRRKDGTTKNDTNKKHSAEEKLAIVLRYLNDHESMKEIQKKTGISHGQIINWVRIYQQKGPEDLERKRGGNPFAALHASKSIMEVERLRLENFKLTLENERKKRGIK